MNKQQPSPLALCLLRAAQRGREVLTGESKEAADSRNPAREDESAASDTPSKEEKGTR